MKVLLKDTGNDMIVKDGSKYKVVSKDGKSLGEYGTEAEAKKRLQEVEYFKHKKGLLGEK